MVSCVNSFNDKIIHSDFGVYKTYSSETIL